MTRSESTTPVSPDKPAEDRDHALIARILAGERELFHELVRPCEKSVYFAAYSLLRNEQDAEDVAQEADPQGAEELAHVSRRGQVQHMAGFDCAQRGARPAAP